MKQYDKYKPSGVEWIGDIPEGWKLDRIKWNAILEYGESLSVVDRNDGQIPVFGSNGIAGFHDTAITKSPCIIIGRKGSFGKVNWSNVECFPIDTTYFIDGTKTRNHLRWLLYLLPNLGLDLFSRDTGVPGLNREDAYQNKVPIPPLTEQTAIANYLDEKTAQIDSLIGNKEKLIELLTEERTAVINQAVTRGTDPHVKLKASGIDWLGNIPEHWVCWKIKRRVAKITDGEHLSPSFLTEGVPFLSAKDVCDREISFDVDKFVSVEDAVKFRKRCGPEKGDLLIVSRGATIGRIGLVETEKEFCLLGSVILVKPHRNKISSIYLYYLLTSDIIQKQFLLLSASSAQQAIYIINVQEQYIPLPSLEEQKRVEIYLEEESYKIKITISKIEKEIELLQEYRTALISEVVTGKIKVMN